MSKMSANLSQVIDGCLHGKRKSQKQLYELYYPFAYTVCRKYAKNRQEAEEIINNGFLKIFNKLETYEPSLKFENWARRIFINAAIDYFRKFKSYRITEGEDVDSGAENRGVAPTILQQLTTEEILACTAQLPPSYLLVFNLYVVDGFTHTEISKKLNISIGTSKSNLSKARQKLQQLLRQLYDL